MNTMVRLVTRLIVAQAGADAAIGLCYSRRHVPSILITLMLVAGVCFLAAVARTGTHVAWLVTLGGESAFIVLGVVRFITSRYVGGTLLAIIAMIALLHPAVARAFSGAGAAAERGEPALGEAGPGA